jgi:C4-dicarboxylate-specific signal transduction histidine kinase
VVARVRALFRKEATIRESTDLNSLIMDLVRLLRDEAIRRDTSIKLALGDDLLLADLDPVQIQQVLLNLVTNGMDAMEDTSGPRQLTIRPEMQAENEIRVTVEDRGPGLTPEAAARLFEPFFSTKRKAQEWDWLFVAVSSKRTMGGFGQRNRWRAIRCFVSRSECSHDGAGGFCKA